MRSAANELETVMLQEGTKLMNAEKAKLNPGQVLDLLEEVLHQVVNLDGYLFINDLHERTITHKIAEYLQPLFHEWNVDLEYNRDGHNTKRVNLNQVPDASWDAGSNVFPDIIVHHRGNNENNLLIIEAKKRHQFNSAIDKHDRRKIQAFSTGLDYLCGAALNLRIGDGEGERIELHFFTDEEWSDPIRI